MVEQGDVTFAESAHRSNAICVFIAQKIDRARFRRGVEETITAKPAEKMGTIAQDNYSPFITELANGSEGCIW